MQDERKRFDVPDGVDAPTTDSSAPAADQETIEALQAEIARLRHDVLTSRDFAIGAEAELGRLRVEVKRYKHESREYHRRLNELYGSRSWRIGQVITEPARKVRRLLRGPA